MRRRFVIAGRSSAHHFVRTFSIFCHKEAHETEKTEFDGEDVIVIAYDSGYDSYDSTAGKFPISFLFEDASQHKDWYEKKRQKEKEAYEKKRQQLERERELRELQRLQEKYQSESEA